MSELKSGLWYRCRDFVTEQSDGEWDDKTIANDADKLMDFVNKEGAGQDIRFSEMLAALKLAASIVGHPNSCAGQLIADTIAKAECR